MIRQQTGVNSILILANTIFMKLKEEGALGISVKTATVLLYLVNFLSSIFTNFLSKFYGQKKILMFGQLDIIILLALTALFSQIKYSGSLILCLVLFITIFNLSIGSLSYIHAHETCVDAAVGFATRGIP